MFEGSLIESLSTQPRHPWTKAVSFAIQTLLIAVALLASLVYTEALPNHAFSFWIQSPPPATAPPSPSPAAPSHKPIQSELNNGQLLLPSAIPITVAVIHDDTEASTSSSAALEGAVPGAVPGSTGDRMLTNLMQGVRPAVPRSVIPRTLRLSSGVAQGFLIHRVQPQYPSLARSARIEGMVVLQAIIDKDGTIQNLRLVSGHPLLVQAAMDAVRQWRYRPYELNHEPVEVETTIQVNFTLSGEN